MISSFLAGSVFLCLRRVDLNRRNTGICRRCKLQHCSGLPRTKRKLPVLKLGGSYRIRESDLVKASELFSTQKLSKKTAGPSLANGLPALNGQQGAQGQDQMNTARANVNG